MDICVTTLRGLIKYDSEKCCLIWLHRPNERKCFNTRFAGKEAFTYTDSHGYKVGRIFGRKYYAHRVVWALHYGGWPTEDIDHINGIKTDNMIENLRLASDSQNLANRGIPSNNTSGYKGVSFDKSRGKWEAYVTIEGKRLHLGRYANAIDAHHAYKLASARLFGQFARWN